MTDTQELAHLVEEREAAAREARDLLEQQHVAEQQKRQAEVEQREVDFLRTWQSTAAAMEAEEKAARRRFEQAVRDSPIFSAWIEYRAGRWRRTHLLDDVISVMNRHGQPNPPTMLDYRQPRLMEDVLDVAEREARARAADESDERHQARGA